jgi:hypothetical protein
MSTCSPDVLAELLSNGSYGLATNCVSYSHVGMIIHSPTGPKDNKVSHFRQKFKSNSSKGHIKPDFINYRFTALPSHSPSFYKLLIFVRQLATQDCHCVKTMCLSITQPYKNHD